MQELIVPFTQEGRPLYRFLLKQYPQFSKDFIFKLIRKRRVKINGKRGDYDDILCTGDRIVFSLKELEAETEALAIPDEDEPAITAEEIDQLLAKFPIIYEDEHVMVVFKPIGILSQSNLTDQNDDLIHLVNRYLRLKNPRAFRDFVASSINRLDRNTEGLVLFGKTYQALRVLNESMREKKIHKFYLGVVKGEFNRELSLRHYIQKSQDENIAVIYDINVPGSALCESRIFPLAIGETISLVGMELITGKSHQLRAQLAYIEHPIVGDPKYGEKDINDFFFHNYDINSQLLLAYQLRFQGIHPPVQYLNYQVFRSPAEARLLTFSEEYFGKLSEIFLRAKVPALKP